MKIFLIGGCGFIGSNLTNYLLKKYDFVKIKIVDSMITGKRAFLDTNLSNSKLEIIEDDVINFNNLVKYISGSDMIIHLAANADIASSSINPTIDFKNGTVLTNNVLEAMRLNNISKLIYSSGSGVYGDLGDACIFEDTGSFMPISTYGASKLASESLISSYCHMFNINATVYRFANVVGPNQTHGVGYDFIRKLRNNPKELHILGNGKQLKPYIHVSDVIKAIDLSLFHNFQNKLNTFNLSNMDSISVDEIAKIVIQILKLNDVSITYSGGNIGWKGDVPFYNLDSSKIRSLLSWTHTMSSREAIIDSIKSNMYMDF